ncbi:MAG: DmsE family decaheme c-type cytochrome [Thermoanaerobaculia bacterium]|nr:DmsE family decaheme c-type cytochrome [Thermoanaerobaculia bacterium]
MARLGIALLGLIGASVASASPPALPSHPVESPVTTVSAHSSSSTSSALPSSSPAAPRPDDMGVEYIGSETCVGCHDTVEEHLATSPHASAAFASRSDLGCETCHGPGGLHLEDPDVVENQPRVDRLSKERQSETCRTCHSGGEQFFWPGSIHDSRGVSCLDCHSIHEPVSVTAELKKETVTDSCLTCHKDVRADLWKTSHHPIREGQISCADCHNPHGSTTESLLRSESVNEQCWSCHTEKRGPFLWEHPPVRENCMNCHTPHGSNHLKLQKTSVPYLCQQCHSNTRHPGTPYAVTNLGDEPRASNRIFNRACLNCHAAVHGSNHPSSPYLGH